MCAALDLDELAGRLDGLEARCGPARLVAVDGHAGSGKSTFAAQLAKRLAGAPVVRLDDIASHDVLFGWTERFLAWIVEPLSEGRPARFAGYDWRRRAFLHAYELPPGPLVLVEGVGAGRRALRPWLSALLWMDLPRDVAWERGMRRDGAEQAAFWRRWREAETEHFAADPSRPYADFLVYGQGDFWSIVSGPGGGSDDSSVHYSK